MQDSFDNLCPDGNVPTVRWIGARPWGSLANSSIRHTLRNSPLEPLRSRRPMHKTLSLNVIGDGPHVAQITHIAESLGVAIRHFRMADIASENPAYFHHSMNIGAFLGPSGSYQFVPPADHESRLTAAINWKSPIILQELGDLDFSGRFLALGFPGSGNGIVQAILERLVAARAGDSHLDSSEATRYLSAFAASYLGDILEELANLGATLGTTTIRCATVREHTISATLTSDGRRCGLWGIPLKNYLYETLHKSHEPSGKMIRKLQDSGVVSILVVRNPLDIIVSLARKLGVRGVDVLSSTSVFRAVATSIRDYYASFQLGSPQDRLLVVRYEDLYSHWRDTVSYLSTNIRSALNSEDIDRMQAQLLGKPVARPGHLWKGGAGKYQSYLGVQHYRELAAIDYGDLMDYLQYPWEPLGAVEVPPAQMEIAALTQESKVQALGILTHCLGITKKVTELIPEFRDHVYSCDKLTLVASEPSALAIMRDFIQTSSRRVLFAAGAID